MSTLLWEECLRGGDVWSHVLKRGTALRIIDTEGGANVGAVFFNADQLTERYNMPDTLKAQHTAHLTKSFVLYSDMGRVLCSITDDTCGWHDPICGHANAEQTRNQFGEKRYQEARNNFYRNAHDNFLVELEKWGLSLRDLPPNVNFFSKVTVQDTGGLEFIAGHSKAGQYVELRAEMNVLVVLDTCPHPLDPTTIYNPKSVSLEIYRVPAPAADDLCRMSRPENERGFINTERYSL